jgi:NADH:ubiquinone oxidoreductase subunit 6 (subunit J)
MNTVLVIGATLGAILCAILAIRASRLLIAALWLAGCSALVSILFYSLGAHEVAVIELSVGAGLVTILLVLAISVAGEEAAELRPIIPQPIAWVLGLGVIGLLALMILPAINSSAPTNEPPFAEVLWQQRGLDALVQSGLIFAAVVGMLGLLAEVKVHAREVHARAKQTATATPPQTAPSIPAAVTPEVKA